MYQSPLSLLFDPTRSGCRTRTKQKSPYADSASPRFTGLGRNEGSTCPAVRTPNVLVICTTWLVDHTLGTIIASATIPNTSPQENPAMVPIQYWPMSLLRHAVFELVLGANAL